MNFTLQPEWIPYIKLMLAVGGGVLLGVLIQYLFAQAKQSSALRTLIWMRAVLKLSITNRTIIIKQSKQIQHPLRIRTLKPVTPLCFECKPDAL
jgi:hypothetical protein